MTKGSTMHRLSAVDSLEHACHEMEATVRAIDVTPAAAIRDVVKNELVIHAEMLAKEPANLLEAQFVIAELAIELLVGRIDAIVAQARKERTS